MSIDEGNPPTHAIPETNMFCFSNSVPKKFTDEEVLESAKIAFNTLFFAGGTLKKLYEWCLIETWEGAVAYLEENFEAIKKIKIDEPKLRKGGNKYGIFLSKERDDFLSGKELKKSVTLYTNCLLYTSPSPRD